MTGNALSVSKKRGGGGGGGGCLRLAFTKPRRAADEQILIHPEPEKKDGRVRGRLADHSPFPHNTQAGTHLNTPREETKRNIHRHPSWPLLGLVYSKQLAPLLTIAMLSRE